MQFFYLKKTTPPPPKKKKKKKKNHSIAPGLPEKTPFRQLKVRLRFVLGIPALHYRLHSDGRCIQIL